jgi:hypothetical protein
MWMTFFEKWVRSVCKACYAVRGIETKEERMKALAAYLEKQGNYDELSRTTAQNWILYGDWSYRKNDELTLNDFFPTKEQLARGLSDNNFILLSRQEFNLKIQKAKNHEMVTNVEHEPMPLPKNKDRPPIFTLEMLNKRQE